MSNKRLKILYRKNLNMSPGKLAAQAVHAALLLNAFTDDVDDVAMSVVVLGVSNAKFEQAKNDIKGTRP
jgi:peptidyl-tRNA hydrolase